MMLTDLADAARKSGLKVVEISDWRTRGRPASTGGFDPKGWLDHHTGSYDGLADAASDLEYAEWLANVGRPGDGLPAPLCNLALSAECVVYVIAAGRANHAGKARATGPMPACDGNEIYGGTEAMNSGSQGWDSRGRDAAGNPVTQGEALARLDAAIALHYGWPASHVRGHKETSLTGKWDPGLLDMDQHRAAVAALMEDDMALTDQEISKIADAVREEKLSNDGYLGWNIADTRERLVRTEAKLDALIAALGPTVQAAVEETLPGLLADAVVNVDVNVNQNGA